MGCSNKGLGYPDKMTFGEMAAFEMMNLGYVLKFIVFCKSIKVILLTCCLQGIFGLLNK